MPLKVFLSWSGTKSHKVACALREWLPSVVQSIQPYVSSEDIDKGTRWSTDIAEELEQSSYGILCITSDNLNAPWVCFEAGALSKTIDKSNVTPFLFDVKRSEVQGPLLQFQSAICEREDVFKLLKSVNCRNDDSSRLADDKLQRSFDIWWDELRKALDGIRDSIQTTDFLGKRPSPNKDEILEEILELVRKQQRVLSEPENLLPRGYLEWVFRDLRAIRPRSHRLFAQLHETAIELERLAEEIARDSVEGKKIMTVAHELHMLVHELEGRSRSIRHSLNEPKREPKGNLE